MPIIDILIVLTGKNILEFTKMADVPEVIRSKAPPCMLISVSFLHEDYLDVSIHNTPAYYPV